MVDFSKRAVNVMVSPEQKTIYVASPLAGSVEKFKMFIMECIADSGPDLGKTSDNILFRYVLDVDKVPHRFAQRRHPLYEARHSLAVPGCGTQVYPCRDER